MEKGNAGVKSVQWKCRGDGWEWSQQEPAAGDCRRCEVRWVKFGSLDGDFRVGFGIDFSLSIVVLALAGDPEGEEEVESLVLARFRPPI